MKNNDEFRKLVIDAYCKARSEGLEATAEGLLEILTTNLRDYERQKRTFADLTVPPTPIPIHALH